MKITAILRAGLFAPLFLGFMLGFSSANAQEIRKLTLEECIDIALNNNISVQRARNDALMASSNKKQSLLNFLPSLQARANYNNRTGTFWDENAARQVSDVTSTSSPNINAGLLIFNGLRNHHNKKQRNNEYNASNYAVEGTKQTVKTNVIAFYLNLAADKENIKISEGRLALLTRQLEREEKREQAGVGQIEEVYNLRSQVANEKLNLVTLKNTYERDRLLLIQALQLENVQNIDISDLEISDQEIEQQIELYQNVIDKVMVTSPDLKSANYSLEASKNALNVARADRYPTITVFGEIGSSYSSNGARNPATGELDPDASLMDQLEFNEYEGAFFSLNIPIFNRGLTNNNIQIAKINMVNAKLDLKQAELDLTNAVQQAYLDLINAKGTYDAAKENLIALEQSFKFMASRYNAGNSDFYAYLESLNNKNRAEMELNNARYSIALRKKILNILQGLE